MIPIREMSQSELGAYVQSHLRDKGIHVILSGGASVAIYTNNLYVSPDLDFVNTHFTKRSVLQSAMQEIGFQENGRYFEHPETSFLVEFPPGPLTVGEEPIRHINEIPFATGMLQVISPTDCVKDRLSAFYHWSDRQCLAQAILVANSQTTDIEDIRQWSLGEGKLEEFKEFLARLAP